MWYFDTSHPDGCMKINSNIPAPILWGGLKNATFKDKLGNVITLAKIVANGVVYHLAETKKAGVAAFDKVDGTVTFVAPDGWFDANLSAEKTQGKSIGEVLRDIEAVLTNNPITPWDNLLAYFDDDYRLAELSSFAKVSARAYGSNSPTFTATPDPNYGKINTVPRLIDFTLDALSGTGFGSQPFSSLMWNGKVGVAITWQLGETSTGPNISVFGFEFKP